MAGNQGGYDKPFHAGSVPLGRNKEITDDFSFLGQAFDASARARKSSADGPLKPSRPETGKVVTSPPLGV